MRSIKLRILQFNEKTGCVGEEGEGAGGRGLLTCSPLRVEAHANMEKHSD